MAKQSANILFTCGREVEYPRNALILSILKEAYSTDAITSSSLKIMARYPSIALRLVAKPKGRYRLVYVGFLGQPLVPFIRLFWKGPILFDAFISIYDTLCFDRKRVSPGSLIGRLAFWIDRLSCSLADKILLDTEAHARYFQQTFRLPAKKFAVLHVGCEDDLFIPQPAGRETDTVLFYGSFLPLHGVDVIVRAAALLKGTGIRFKIIGAGMEKKRIEAMIGQLGANNVSLCPPVPLRQLPDEIAQASVCLGGHFGVSEKAGRVIAGKTFQCIAMGKPTIVGDNPANRELLTHGKDAWFCEMGSPQALADAVQTLMRAPDLRQSLGAQARATFLTHASRGVLAAQLTRVVDQMLG